MSDKDLRQASPSAEGVEKAQRRTRWLLWLQWVLTCAVGFVFAGFSLGAVSTHLYGSTGGLLPYGTIVGPWDFLVPMVSLGLVVMWLWLWRSHSGTGWWKLFMILGLASAGALSIFPVVGFAYDDPLAELGVAISLGCFAVPAGLLFGLLHWLALRQRVKGAGRWVPFAVVAFVAGLGAASLASAALFPDRASDRLPEALGLALSLAAGGLGYGAITGRALLRLLKPHPVEVRETKSDPVRILQSGQPYLARQDAAERLGRAGSSSAQIVQALIAAQESDPYAEVRRAADKALRAPVHQEYLQQHPDLMEAAERARKRRTDADASTEPADRGPKQ